MAAGAQISKPPTSVSQRIAQLERARSQQAGESRSSASMAPPRLSKPLSSERFRPSALSFWSNRESQSSDSHSPSSSASTSRHRGDPTQSSGRQRSDSSRSPPIVGLNEELEELDRQREGAEEREQEQPSPATLPHKDSSGSAATPSRHTPPWNSQSEWAKYESFVHPFDVLPTGDEGEVEISEDETEELRDRADGGGGDKVGTEEARERAKRRRRKLLELKRRKGRKKLNANVDSDDPESSFTWNSSSEDEDESDEVPQSDSQCSSGGRQSLSQGPPLPSPSLSLSPSPSLQFSTPLNDADTFYDADSSSLPLFSPLTDEDHDRFPEQESSRLRLSPRAHTTTASSATLRQDAVDRQHDLQHQGSSSTLLAMSSTSTPTKGSAKKRTALPPLRPSPTQPLPAPPTPPVGGEGEGTMEQGRERAKVPAVTSPSALAAPPLPPSPPAQPAQLGPTGTIRGRPRGATVGAVPGGKVEVKQRTRPRSMLCNEVPSSETEALQMLQQPVASSSSSSLPQSTDASSGKSGKRGSLSGYPATSAVPDGEPTPRSSLGMTRTPSSSANSSSIGVASSSVLSSEGGSRSRSGSNTSLLQQVQQYRPRSHASFVIAVVGHRGAGKSTVIKKGLRQFGLSKPNVLSEKITSHSTVCIVDHEQRTIEVLEMDASVLLNGPLKRFAWPKFLPPIDAVILCYDASQISSFRGMSELLENFALNHLSTVMLACKSEINPKMVDPYYASDMAAVYNVGLAECTVQSEEGKKRMRDCFSFLVKEVAKSRGPKGTGSVHGMSPQPQPHSHQGDDGQMDLQETLVSHDTPVAAATETRWRQNTERKMSDATTASGEVYVDEEGGSALQESIQKAQLGLQSAKSAGGYVSIEELWDKLFYAAVSGNDERFLLMFMVFYRGFVQPIDLLRQVISRFDALARGERTDSVMIRYSLMRLTTMLGDWMQEYPGDLSGPETYPLLCQFFQKLLRHPSTVHVAAPMQILLESVRESPDVDVVWSKNQDSDKPRSVAADVPPVKPAGVESTEAKAASASQGGSRAEARSRSQSTSSSFHEAFVSVPRILLDVEGRHRSASDVTNSSDGQTSTSGSSLAISSTSVPTPGTNGTSIMNTAGPTPSAPASLAASTSSTGTPSSQGHQSTTSGMGQKAMLRNASNLLFDVREESVAQELTRMEWDLFSAVGSRDLLRHILVSRSVRLPDSPVARSIAHFNYISSWVCSMILVQSKTKQRARLLEKFMETAWILRKINNYNTLHAVLAGLGNASVHRLKNTRELLNGKPVIKTYQSLARLMGNDRSFAAYRLALENSEGRTIPYLGVHLQDILSMSDGNPSKRGSDGMIHWKKFCLMDEAVMAIVKCQQYQEPLRENPTISQLIFDLPVMDDDTLYQRSLQVEPRQSSAAAGSAGSRIIKQFFHVDA